MTLASSTTHTTPPATAPHPALPAAPTGWYVCITKPRQENYAAQKLQEQGYEFYLPVLRQWAKRVGGWQPKDSVMFPRYAFVRPGQPGQALGPVRSTPGVTGLVKFGPVFALLPEAHMQALRQVVDAASQAQPQNPLQAGQHVVFSEGPLKGLVGIVSSVADERVKVMLSLLGRPQTVTAQANQLAPAAAPQG